MNKATEIRFNHATILAVRKLEIFYPFSDNERKIMIARMKKLFNDSINEFESI